MIDVIHECVKQAMTLPVNRLDSQSQDRINIAKLLFLIQKTADGERLKIGYLLDNSINFMSNMP
jgi:hypothetical protein